MDYTVPTSSSTRTTAPYEHVPNGKPVDPSQPPDGEVVEEQQHQLLQLGERLGRRLAGRGERHVPLERKERKGYS